MRHTWSIRWRLVAALAGVSLFTLLVVGLVFYPLIGGYVIGQQKEQLLNQAIEVADQVQSFSSALPTQGLGLRVLNGLLKSDLRGLPTGAGIAVFKDSSLMTKVGGIPVRDQYVERLRTEAEQLGQDAAGSAVLRDLPNAGGKEAVVLLGAAPITFSDGTQGVAAVTLARADAFTARTGVLRTLLIAAAIAIGLAILVGLGLGGWLTRPLRRLSSAAREMATGSYEKPVTGAYPGEVQELADSMEIMRREVRRSEESLRGFVASAAHELRTPLTSIQGFSEALLDGVADTPEQQRRSAAAIYRESTRLQRLVDALLTLSRYDSHEFEPAIAPVVVENVVAEEIDRLVQVGVAEQARIAVQIETGAQVATDPDMFRQIVANLLRNAVQYGGADPIAVRAWTQGSEFALEVVNGGEPLSVEERGRIFTRFYRGRGARQSDGLGLGLALVREICDVLGGRVELLEGGPPIRFRVTLPLAPERPRAA